MVLDADHRVSLVTPAASRLLPRATPGATVAEALPAWLADADGTGRRAAQHGPPGRRTSADRVDLPGGRRAWLMYAGERTSWRERWRTERQRSDFLVRASASLLTTLNWERCLRLTASLASEELAEVAAVVAPRGHRIEVVLARGGEVVAQRGLAEDVHEVPGLADAMAGFPPVPARWVSPEETPAWLLPDGFDKSGSMVVTPLPGNGVAAGALVLVRGHGQARFDEEEEVHARVFAARAGAAVSAASLYSHAAETAAVLQRALLPPPLATVRGLDLAAAYRPALEADRIGGDFYDVHPAAAPGGETFLFLGDVCGKGASAAVLTGKIRNTLDALHRVESDHLRLLTLLNESLLEADDARFVTLVLVGATPLPHGGVRLRVTAAGHPSPMVVRTDGAVEPAAFDGTLVGALPRITARTREVRLGPGDACLLYSDGITEARGGLDGTMFGEERLRDVLGECGALPVEATVERVDMLASDWLRQGARDDMALLAVGAPRHRRLRAVEESDTGTGR
ncbi:serine/threonine-protein phosphatase [Streptomyces durbertensis]|uniref:Serine/threonine-protein phosphatase n=1 Tax=Streptomyces durbertensis TaxID=2448886 RepID=A0ABR6ELE6_9ACTN|nr:serine/threonine-protein phosphatase [Streptomyces durbertensis]